VGEGQVENQVGLARDNLFEPQLRFKTLEELNGWLEQRADCALASALIASGMGAHSDQRSNQRRTPPLPARQLSAFNRIRIKVEVNAEH
jgi:hypothetical protein